MERRIGGKAHLWTRKVYEGSALLRLRLVRYAVHVHPGANNLPGVLQHLRRIHHENNNLALLDLQQILVRTVQKAVLPTHLPRTSRLTMRIKKRPNMKTRSLTGSKGREGEERPWEA